MRDAAFRATAAACAEREKVGSNTTPRSFGFFTVGTWALPIETGSCRFICFVHGVKKLTLDFEAEIDMPLFATHDSYSAAVALREAAIASTSEEVLAA